MQFSRLSRGFRNFPLSERSVQFYTYVFELLQTDDVYQILSAGISVYAKPSATEKLLETYRMGGTKSFALQQSRWKKVL